MPSKLLFLFELSAYKAHTHLYIHIYIYIYMHRLHIFMPEVHFMPGWHSVLEC